MTTKDDDDDPPAGCQDYRPDHNGECLNCDEPAFAHADPFHVCPYCDRIMSVREKTDQQCCDDCHAGRR